MDRNPHWKHAEQSRDCTDARWDKQPNTTCSNGDHDEKNLKALSIVILKDVATATRSPLEYGGALYQYGLALGNRWSRERSTV